jgi:hypothetical protein
MASFQNCTIAAILKVVIKCENVEDLTSYINYARLCILNSILRSTVYLRLKVCLAKAYFLTVLPNINSGSHTKTCKQQG